MMKRILLLLFAIFITSTCFSRSNMFLDIPYSVDTETFIDCLLEKGYTIYPEYCIENDTYVFKGRYLSEDVWVTINCDPNNDIVYTVIVDFYTYAVPANGSPLALEKLYSKYNYLKNWLSSQSSGLTSVEESSGEVVEKVYNMVHLVEQWSKNVWIKINDEGKRALVLSFHDDRAIDNMLW